MNHRAGIGRDPRRQAGFTLFEVLSALTLLGLLLLVLALGTQFGLAAWRSQEQVTGVSDELNAADRVIRHLIENIDPGYEGNPAEFRGAPSAVAFRSELPLAAGPETARRIDAVLGVDASHQLVLRWLPYSHARPLASAGPARIARLAGDVDRLELRYWVRPRPTQPGRWVDTWVSRDPPLLIGIRLIGFPGANRLWPEIVVALHRQRPAE